MKYLKRISSGKNSFPAASGRISGLNLPAAECHRSHELRWINGKNFYGRYRSPWNCLCSRGRERLYFTGIGEEFGFIGAAVVILLLTFLVFRIMLAATRASDMMGRIIAAGAASIIMFQTFINIGVVSMILPNTGIPLPFVSSGLSSVVGCYSMLGLVINISINTGKQRPATPKDSF
ncbi:MAG: FtsW/RodA/SpoVE family cell cycle protein [Lachnospiraceae bacterium]|nr:FtsW/RodA/SpoVE family cell cycle protein [Lachnospiraceae bacterium]